MAAFVLDAMPVDAASQSALSNNIVTEHQELWSGVQFYVMDGPICCELRIILITIGTSVKCYRSKSFPSFKASLEPAFSGIMHAQELQRLFETFAQPNTCNFFLRLLIRRMCRLLNTCGIWLAVVLLVIRVL